MFLQLLLCHFQADFLTVLVCPSALRHQHAEEPIKKNFKGNRNNLMIVSHICKLAFYHFTTIKESSGCVLRLLSKSPVTSASPRRAAECGALLPEIQLWHPHPSLWLPSSLFTT